MPEQPMLVAYGGQVKALENGKIGGYLVRFSGPRDPDLYGDFFTSTSDFGIHKQFPLHYAHGFDSVLKERRIGLGTITKDDVGLWFEAQLEQRDEYEKMIGELIEAGKLGYSSGAVGHLVTRKEAPNGAFEIKSWPIGEASLTPRPAEPRNSVMALKEYIDTLNTDQTLKAEAKSGGPEPQAAEVITEAPDIPEAATPIKSHRVEEPEMPEIKESPEVKTELITEVKTDNSQERMLSIMERMEARLSEVEQKAAATLAQPEVRHVVETPETKSAPAIISHRGHDERKAYHAWIKGDLKAVDGTKQFVRVGELSLELKASNPTDMNITTPADGGNTVPTGHFDTIMEKKKESDLTDLLGLIRVPGVGTTTNVPVDASGDGAFVATAEAGAYDLDAPVINQQAFTLAKFTKKVILSEELLEDTTANLLQFIERYVAKGLAVTNNTLIVAEAELGGTEAKVLLKAGIAAGDIEKLAFNAGVQDYLDSANTAWLTSAPTYGAVASLTGNDRIYAEQTIASTFGTRRPSLLGHPVYFSSKVDADGTGGNKPIFFGDWSQMGYYNSPMTVVRDPFSSASAGQVNLFYRMRTDYEILQAAAIVYGRNSVT